MNHDLFNIEFVWLSFKSYLSNGSSFMLTDFSDAGGIPLSTFLGSTNKEIKNRNE